MKAKINGHKIELIPLLIVDEKKTTDERIKQSLTNFVLVLVAWIVVSVFVYHGKFVLTIAWIAVIIGWPLISFLFPGKHTFWLCKKGVYLKERRLLVVIRSWFYPWNSFQYFVVDQSKKQFELKRSIGFILLTSREHFDEVKQILSEHISPKQ